MYQYMSLGIRPAGISSVLSVSGLRASVQYMSLIIRPAGIKFSIMDIRPAGISQYLRIGYLRVSDSVLRGQ